MIVAFYAPCSLHVSKVEYLFVILHVIGDARSGVSTCRRFSPIVAALQFGGGGESSSLEKREPEP